MIKDSVYLVTGGASGLGKGVAEKLLSEGANVVVLDLQSPPQNDSLRTYGDRVVFFQIDITSEKEVLNALDATKRKFKKLNGVISCASICQYHPIYDFEKKEAHSLKEFTSIVTGFPVITDKRVMVGDKIKINEWHELEKFCDAKNKFVQGYIQMLLVNLIGTFNVIRLAVPLLLENELNENGERGVIITTSSVAGHQGRPNLIAYSASKAGIIGMTYPLAKELNGHGIRVVDLAPGSYAAPMYQDIMTHHKKGEYVSSKILGQPSDFGDFVKAVIETSMLNGTSVRLDGGLKSQ